MTPTEIVATAIVETLGVTDEQARDPSADIQCDLGGDSLDTLEIVMLIEDAHGLHFADLEVQACKTVGDLVGMTAAKMGVAA
jgi:acyl carrier protein